MKKEVLALSLAALVLLGAGCENASRSAAGEKMGDDSAASVVTPGYGAEPLVDDNIVSDNDSVTVEKSGALDADKSEDENDNDEAERDEPAAPVAASYTLAEVAKHATAVDCWTAINGEVYNVTKWIAQHPGGQRAIVGTCGVDASDVFNGKHGGQARPVSELTSFLIGSLKK